MVNVKFKCSICNFTFCGLKCFTKHKCKNGFSLLKYHVGDVTQQFNDRWRDSDILVIGAAYGASEYKRWGFIDPNYIGIGFEWKKERAYIDVENNELAGDWEKEPIWHKLITKSRHDGKRFDAIYMDYSVDKFIPQTMLKEMVRTIPELLNPDGLLYIPAGRGTSLRVGYFGTLSINFIIHDGETLVPQICFSDVRDVKRLSERLSSQGVEILKNGDKCIIIYTKLYNEGESQEGFHKGYSIKTFFETFGDLQQYIDPINLQQYTGFFEKFAPYEEPQYYQNFTTMSYLFEDELPSPSGHGMVKYVVLNQNVLAGLELEKEAGQT